MRAVERRGMLVDLERIFTDEQLFHGFEVLWRNPGADAHQALIRVHFSRGESANLNV